MFKTTLSSHLRILLFVLFILLLQCNNSDASTKIEEFHIAVAGSIKNDSHSTDFKKGVQFLIDDHNKQAQKFGFRIVLDEYNDKNQIILAKQIANKIAKSNLVLGVIGHSQSSTSIAAAKIYEQAGIPAITPSATAVGVTKNNNWYFSSIFNDKSQTSYLVNYIKNILHKTEVLILHDEKTYARNLVKYFKINSGKQNVKISSSIEFNSSLLKSSSFKNMLLDVLNKQQKKSAIFIAAHYKVGAEIIKLLRDLGVTNTIVAPDSFANSNFVNSFSNYPKENESPGYYANGIYVSVPLMYETGSYKAQKFYRSYIDKYNSKPDWRTAFAYDAALLFVNAIKKTAIAKNAKNKKDIKTKRKIIRDYLSNMNSSEKSILGITGLNYFSAQGFSTKPLTMAKYFNRELIPASTQVKGIVNYGIIDNLEEAKENDLITNFGSELMHKVNIIYTGVSINKISELDIDEMTYKMDFDIWFRYKMDVSFKNIKFLNAVEKIKIPKATEKILIGDMYFIRYNIVSRFQGDFIQVPSFGKHILGLKFVHKFISGKNLVFVPDTIGGNPLQSKVTLSTKSILENNSNWVISKIWSYQDTYTRKVLGNIADINSHTGMIDYSLFVSALEIKKSSISVRKSISSIYINVSLLFLGIIVYLLYNNKINLIKKINFRKQLEVNTQSKDTKVVDNLELKKSWMFSSIALIVVVLAAEPLLIEFLYQKVHVKSLLKVEHIFSILWWFVLATIISSAIKVFIWNYIEEKSEREIPLFSKGSVTFLVYTFMFFAIIAFVYDQKLTSILGASGIFLMIIGLAMQMNIVNIFAGIVLHMQKTIRVGDWIKISDLDEGKVVKLTWRTTVIEKRIGTTIIIPNTTIADSEIENFSTVKNPIFDSIEIDIDKKIALEKVIKVMSEVLDSIEQNDENVLADGVMLAGYSSWSAKYKVKYYIHDYAKKYVIRNKLLNDIAIQLRKNKIKIAHVGLAVDV